MTNGRLNDPVYVASKKFEEVGEVERRELGLASKLDALGLALSGGGIRSASFALGVLQALHAFGVFERFHYLSTVSGGGYIGSSLTYFRNIFPFPNPAADKNLNWFPFGLSTAVGPASVKTIGARVDVAPLSPNDQRAQLIVSYLRQHAAYLVPSRQLGLHALIAGALRGLITTALPYFAILAGLLGLAVVLGLDSPKSPSVPFVDLPTFQMSAAAPPPEAEKTAVEASTQDAGTATSAQAEPSEPKSKQTKPSKTKPPLPYLAALPTAIALGIGLAFVLVALCFSLLGGLINRFDRRGRTSPTGYWSLIWFYASAGWLLVLAIALLALATLPWVHRYLDYLMHVGTNLDLPGSFSALVAAFVGAFGLVAKMRGVLGGAEQPPSLLRRIGLVLAGFAFVYGILLLAFAAGATLAGGPSGVVNHVGILEQNQSGRSERSWLPSVITLAVGLVAAWISNVNHAAQHRLYRDRLMEVFCAQDTALDKCSWEHARTAQSRAGWLANMVTPLQPMHLINTAAITTDSSDRRFRGRGSDNFVLSPFYCGSDATGWADIQAYQPDLTIATACAISGAALNAHAGPHGGGLLRNKAYAAVLSFLGLHLGYWAQNPRNYENTKRATADGFLTKCASALKLPKSWIESSKVEFTGLPKFRFPNLFLPGLRGISGFDLNEKKQFLQLSDGGHFENLGVYELLRRRVGFLFISDAGQDAEFSFEDLANAIERARVDFGVNLRFHYDEYDLSHLIPKSATSNNPAGTNFIGKYQLATRGYAIGTIEYSNGDKGVVVYVKSTLTRHLPGDLYGYKARNDAYPHQTTLDQFFDEDQFEAYRELGYRLTSRLFRDIEEQRKALGAPSGTTGSPALDRVANALGL